MIRTIFLFHYLTIYHTFFYLKNSIKILNIHYDDTSLKIILLSLELKEMKDTQ